MPLPPARAARGAHTSGAALWARGCVFWTENICFFGQKSASMDPARLFRVYSMSYAQVQPAVPAVGALVIEQGRVGMGGGQRWNRPKIVKIIKLVTQKLFILQLHIIHENWVPVVCGGRAGFLDGS